MGDFHIFAYRLDLSGFNSIHLIFLKNYIFLSEEFMEGHNRLLSGIGASTAIDSFDAGRDAAEKAILALGMSAPALVMVFTTPRYDLKALLGGIRSVTGDALLVGCTGSGEIANGTYLGFQAGVTVLVLGGGTYRFGAASASQIYGNLEKAGQEIARKSRESVGESPYAAIVLFVDQLAGDLQQVVNGIYRVTGTNICMLAEQPVMSRKLSERLYFITSTLSNKGAVLSGLASDRPLKTTVAHGWKPIGTPLLVTRRKEPKYLSCRTSCSSSLGGAAWV
jgi:hypothetical protein